jgi:hypothetical protein
MSNRYAMAFVATTAALLGLAIARFGAPVAAVALVLPLAILMMKRLMTQPVDGLYLTLVVAFIGVGLRRYAEAPTGLLVDGLLAITLLGVLIGRDHRNSIDSLKNVLVVFVVVWFVYNIGQLFNPERPSIAAWFYAVRGVSLYWIVAVPVGLLLFRPRRDLDRFLKWWLSLSLIGTGWGLKQLLIGLDGAEQAWLSIPGNQSTHILFGKLRVFSFYSDSGQFGAAQGHAAVVAGILAVGLRHKGLRLLLGGISAVLTLGLFISGTRGALAVPFVGFLSYLILSKNWRVLSVGLILIVTAFSLLKFTYVGHSVYEIRRMRTAVQQGSDNPSLQVRIENQKRLAAYLEGRPFGGGVGSAGYWGQRFSPDTFLANLALDSWYVKIWAEQGIVGLVLYLLLFALVLFQGLRRLLSCEDEEHRLKLLALFCGVLGIMAASYGNQVLGQMPTGIVAALSLVFLFLPLEPNADRSEGLKASSND